MSSSFSHSMKNSFRFRIIEEVADPLGEENADYIAASSNCILWMDGAAPMGALKKTKYPNDASWFVRRFSECFMSQVDEWGCARDLIHKIQVDTGNEYSSFPQLSYGDELEIPFACVGVARLVNNLLEISNAGDCTLLYEDEKGEISCFGYNSVKALDALVLEQYSGYRKEGLSHSEAFKLIAPKIVENRGLRNKMFGYDVVEPSVNTSVSLERLLIPARHGMKMLAMSDGFYRAVDTYGIFSEKEIFEVSFNYGVSYILNRIREVENSDKEADQFPRIKLKDDASAVAFVIEEI
ncbi:hypothetical protein [Aidingimonas halophila]|uniref:PPM-type phosphatase domain-containing protein n=1 Tax=Aidingimonas halophila TaxID=574349 RepID=A0A1H2X238_9GAMM|nr:hypothetical protein [Aidingimonas halophila]GHC27947.1 hypothetical protein GCM10008094_19530 [Aidingimonas halophila]SDW86554.1 hypothetical protein SAMN05443545_10373 [Aidingimonas halophila]